MAVSGKNRPAWRVPLNKSGRLDAVPPSNPVLFGSPAMRRCKALARSTGERCRAPAMQGAACCRAHGGYAQAIRAERERYGDRVISLAAVRRPRSALAAIGATVAGKGSPVERGRQLERTASSASQFFSAVDRAGDALDASPPEIGEPDASAR